MTINHPPHVPTHVPEFARRRLAHHEPDILKCLRVLYSTIERCVTLSLEIDIELTDGAFVTNFFSG